MTATSLNVRSGASTSHAVVGQLSRGTRISGTPSGSWFRIASGTYAGRFVYGQYLKAVTAPAPDPRVSRPVNAPGTTIPHTRSQQVMVARHVSGTTGTWARWEWRGDHWYRVDQTTTAAFGSGGVRPAAEREAGDGTTPLGNFGLVHAFGAGAPTGTKMPYRRTTPCSYWIGDKTQSDYNRWREDCAIPAAVKDKSEDLYYYSNLSTQRQYRQAVVMDFNYAAQKSEGPGSGSAIFLHYSSSGRTLGCVGLMNDAELTRTLRWLDPAKNPQIAVTR